MQKKRGVRAEALPVEVGLEQGELPGDLDGVQRHQVQRLAVPHAPQVPLQGRWGALKGDVVADSICLGFLPLDDFSNGFHPLLHGFAWRREIILKKPQTTREFFNAVVGKVLN